MSRVLVVEDESHLADGLAYNLEAEGHSVQIVADGEAALERLLAGRGSAVSSAPEGSGPEAQAGDVFTFRGKSIDFSTLELSTSGGKIQLTLMEADLLRHLIRSNGRVVSRKSILEEVWGLKEDTDTRAIDNFVVRLRRYIEDDPAKPQHLLTVRGVGYRFLAEPEVADS